MKRLAFLSFVPIGLALASPAQAEPLRFGAINGSDDLSGDTEVASCPSRSFFGGHWQTCTLARTSFGGIPIESGAMTLKPDGRVEAVRIRLEDADYDLAYRFLVGRYGRPMAVEGGAQWNRFDDGGRVAISKSGASTDILFAFPSNDAAAAPGPERFWSLALFVLLGIGAGQLLRQRQKVRRFHRLPAQPSMRETLERRLRENRDPQF
jgi:hypothetical protein